MRNRLLFDEKLKRVYVARTERDVGRGPSVPVFEAADVRELMCERQQHPAYREDGEQEGRGPLNTCVHHVAVSIEIVRSMYQTAASMFP